MDVLMIVAIGGFAVLCGVVSMKIAAGKGRSPFVWGLTGLVLNLAGLLIVLVVPRAGERRAGLSVERRTGDAGKPYGAKAATT